MMYQGQQVVHDASYNHTATCILDSRGGGSATFPGPRIGFKLAILGGTVTSIAAGQGRISLYRNVATSTNLLANGKVGDLTNLNGDGSDELYPGEFCLFVVVGGSVGGLVTFTLRGTLAAY